MPKNEALGLELRQIIKTDETAGGIIAEAKQRRKQIEAGTEAEKQRILDDAARRRENMEKQVEAEQAAVLAERTAAAERQFDESRRRIEQIMDEKREGWKKEIVARILQD